jgi:hypothetical protein
MKTIKNAVAKELIERLTVFLSVFDFNNRLPETAYRTIIHKPFCGGSVCWLSQVFPQLSQLLRNRTANGATLQSQTLLKVNILRKVIISFYYFIILT